MEKNELITVIVPVYNVENYLNECIDSIINQTYTNLEILLVNDGSQDSSGKICDEYKGKDSRIKVMHKTNGGLSDARNFGLELAKGSYVTFIDSDDFIEKDCIEYLYNLITKYDSKISVCAYSILLDNGKKIDSGENYSEEKLSKELALERMLDEKGFTVSACAKLYKTELFENVKYPVEKLCEDNGTTYKLFDQVDYIVYGNISKYNYRKRKNSIMTREFSEDKLDMIELTDEMCNYLEPKYPSLKDSIDRRRMYARFNVLRQSIYSKDKNHKELSKKIRKEILTDYKNVFLHNKKLQFRDKVAYIALFFGLNIYKLFWMIYLKIRRK